MIEQRYIDDLLARIDIIQLIDGRVKLKKTGKNFSALCPFHEEKSPSFTANQEKQLFYCFGCGASGNAIGFLMRFDSMQFGDAVRKLAMQFGMSPPDKATKMELMTVEVKKLREIHRDERLIIAIGDAMSAREETVSAEDKARYSLAHERVRVVTSKLQQMGQLV